MVSFSSTFNNPLLTSSIHPMMSRPSFEAFSSILCLDTICLSLSSIGDKVLIRGAMVYLNAPIILYSMSASQATGGGWECLARKEISIGSSASKTSGYGLSLRRCVPDLCAKQHLAMTTLIRPSCLVVGSWCLTSTPASNKKRHNITL